MKLVTALGAWATRIILRRSDATPGGEILPAMQATTPPP